MTIILDGSGLTIEKLVCIARFGEKVELAPAALGAGAAAGRADACTARAARGEGLAGVALAQADLLAAAPADRGRAVRRAVAGVRELGAAAGAGRGPLAVLARGLAEQQRAAREAAA